MAEKQLSLRQVKTIDDVCRLRRDHFDRGDWLIMTDGIRVWISKQKKGEERTDHIEVPKKVFDALYDRYGTPMPTGKWENERFIVAKPKPRRRR